MRAYEKRNTLEKLVIGKAFVKSHELIPLSETTHTLDLLFQHVYPRSYPCLDGVGYEELAKLAEAAEKYQVYAAMEVCRIHMRYAHAVLDG